MLLSKRAGAKRCTAVTAAICASDPPASATNSASHARLKARLAVRSVSALWLAASMRGALRGLRSRGVTPKNTKPSTRFTAAAISRNGTALSVTMP